MHQRKKICFSAPNLSTDIAANQNIAVVGFVEKCKETENGVQNLSLKGSEQK